MRSEDEYSEEDLEKVRQATSSGIHSVERQPFRFWRLLLAVWLVILFMSGVSWLIADHLGVLV